MKLVGDWTVHSSDRHANPWWRLTNQFNPGCVAHVGARILISDRPIIAHFCRRRGMESLKCGQINQSAAAAAPMVASRLANRRPCSFYAQPVHEGALTTNALPNHQSNHVHQPIDPVMIRAYESGALQSHATQRLGNRAVCDRGRLTSVLSAIWC
jgi:hypothetical protein